MAAWIGTVGVLLVPSPQAADTAPAPRRTTAEVIAAAGPGDWRRARSGEHALPAARRRPGRHRAGAGFCAAARGEHQDAGPRRVFRRPGDRSARRTTSSSSGETPTATGRSSRRRRACRRNSRSRRAARCRSRDCRIADGYAPEVGFSGGFPAARDPRTGETWLVHCYAMVGAGRANEVDSGTGAELYVVTGHAPRQLDRNIALIGRVVQGMELLSVLPRGTGRARFLRAARPSTCRSCRCGWPPTCRRPSARRSS